jgi:uncharacterized protein (TIGR01777 family)
METKTILISGGTGMVGTALTQYLVHHGFSVIILTRNPKAANNPVAEKTKVRFAQWDIKNQSIEAWAVSEADALIHLAGAGVVAKPWTEAYKKEILDSRVESSRLLVNAIAKHGTRLKTVVSASAIGWYGEDAFDGQGPFTEEAPPASGFLGDTCKAWEESIAPVKDLGKRLVICRIGIVLSNEGGALPEFKKPLAFRVAGVLGSGKQMISWIHIEDLCRIFHFAIEHSEAQGVYNATAPSPVSNRELTISLARALYGNAFLTMPVPVFVLKIMLGDRSIEVLKSTAVSSAKLTKAGFQFHFPSIERALEELAQQKSQS